LEKSQVLKASLQARKFRAKDDTYNEKAKSKAC